MKRESIEALRARLLADEQVHSMVEMRAYEIYRLRGGAPGQEAEDWIQAEAEILKFLIEEEARRSEAEAHVAQSMTRGLSDHFAAPIESAPEQIEAAVDGAIAQTDQPASQETETTELASPLGLADFLTDRITGIEPEAAPVEDHATGPQKTRSRVIPAKFPVARKEAGGKPARVKASTKKASTKDSDRKKSGKKPKKS